MFYIDFYALIRILNDKIQHFLGTQSPVIMQIMRILCT